MNQNRETETPPSIAKSREEDQKQLCILSVTRPNVAKLSDGLEDPFWRWLAAEYRAVDHTDTIGRATCDVLNAIVWQRRVCFNLAKRDLKKLMWRSQNWSSERAFRDTQYSKIRLDLLKYVKPIGIPVSRGAQAFEVSHPFVLKSIGCVDVEKQRKECLDFSQRKPKVKSWEPMAGTDHGNQGTKELRNLVPWDSNLPRDPARTREPLMRLLSGLSFDEKVLRMNELILDPTRTRQINALFRRVSESNYNQQEHQTRKPNAQLLNAARLLYRLTEIMDENFDEFGQESYPQYLIRRFGMASGTDHKNSERKKSIG